MEITEILGKLISFKTTAENPKDVQTAFLYIESLFSGLGVDFKYYERNGKLSLLIYPKGTNGHSTKVLFNGHIDVVPAKSGADFLIRIDGDRAYGRGAADMKGGLAAIFIACMALAKNKSDKWAALITSDEEIGGFDGVRYVLEVDDIKPEFVLVGDGPRMDGFFITHKEKGGLWLEIISKGKSAHGARPWLGNNAIDSLIDTINKIKLIVGEVEPNAWKSTVNLASIETSNKTPNVVPDDARAVLDIRFTEALASTPDDLILKIKRELQGAVLNKLTNVEMLFTSENNLKLKLLQDIFSKQVGMNVPLTYGHAASDGRFFSAKGIPTALVGVVGGNWHSEEEWASISSIKSLTEVMKEFVNQY